MRRVVITGMGTVNPIGNSIAEFDVALREGKPGGAIITAFDIEDSPVKIGCEVKGFDPESVRERKAARRTSRFIHLAVGAAKEAVDSSGLDVRAEGDRVGTSIASGIGGMDMQLAAHEHYLDRGIERFSPFWTPGIIPNMGAGYVSMEFGTRGPLASSSTACAASSMAIGDAVMYIRGGLADAMLAGGSECGVTPVGVGGFHGIRACSTRNDDPQGASRPYDVGRDGFVMGEGAGVLVLESEEHAKARGARIYAYVVGAGMTADAHHIAQPDPEGKGARRAILAALEQADASPDDVAHINAHATSTPQGDVAEAVAIRSAMGNAQPLVTGTKSMTGHMLGAAGAIEGIYTVLALHHRLVPATLNLHEQDPEVDIDVVRGAPRELPAGDLLALNNSFGFGGHDVAIAFRTA